MFQLSSTCILRSVQTLYSRASAPTRDQYEGTVGMTSQYLNLTLYFCRLAKVYLELCGEKQNKQTYRPVLLILKLLSTGRFRDRLYFNLCMHCLFGISGLNAHGGTCMNCSFRRMKLEFSSKAVCHDLLVTVHCGLSHPF